MCWARLHVHVGVLTTQSRPRRAELCAELAVTFDFPGDRAPAGRLDERGAHGLAPGTGGGRTSGKSL